MNFKITLTPLDSYFLGGERNAGFGSSQKAPYFISSENVPTQTTLLGLMRYCVLKQNNALTQNFKKKPDNALKKQQNSLVGEESFSFYETEEQSFGVIKNISPVFLERDKILYTRCPLNHNIKVEKGFSPFELDEEATTNYGRQRVPKGYNAKKGLYHGWCPLLKGAELVKDSDIFISQEQVGIAKARNQNETGAFFKKEYKRLQKGWHFTFFANIEGQNNIADYDIVNIGQQKSLFKMECAKCETDWAKLLQNIYIHEQNYNDAFYYAASDCLANLKADELYSLCDFAITSTRPFRHLTTHQEAANYYSFMSKTNVIELLRSGSVFYVKPESEEKFLNVFKNTACKNIGYNQLFQIGGTEK